jgi:hypothetical protein
MSKIKQYGDWTGVDSWPGLWLWCIVISTVVTRCAAQLWPNFDSYRSHYNCRACDVRGMSQLQLNAAAKRLSFLRDIKREHMTIIYPIKCRFGGAIVLEQAHFTSHHTYVKTEKSRSTLCRKSCVFFGYSCFLPQRILTRWFGISPKQAKLTLPP